MAKRPPGEKPTSDAMIAQPHGGRIWQGPAANPVAGPGRPSSEIRRRLRGSLEQRIPILEEIADARVPLREKCPKCGHEPEPTALEAAQPKHDDRLRAIDIMARHGMEDETGISSAEIRRRLTRTIDVIRELLSPKDAHLLIASLRQVWS